METEVVETEGIPEGCVLSVRAGATRRQARKLSAGQDHEFAERPTCTCVSVACHRSEKPSELQLVYSCLPWSSLNDGPMRDMRGSGLL